MRIWCVTVIIGLAGLCAAEQPLVTGGRSAYSIYAAADAPSSVKQAAEELQQYIRKATGAELPIVDKPARPMICLGDNAAARAAGLSVEGMPLEGFRIATRDGSIYILGPDTPDDKRTPMGGVSRGTLFGAYTFLEKFLGVRWVIPGEDGESVPQTKSVVVPDVDMTDAPDFQRRVLPYTQQKRPVVKRWLQRNKVGETLSLHHSHNWRKPIPSTLFDAHPDWFAEHDGKRVPPVGRYKLCTTNPGLVRAFADAAIAAFEANPERPCFSLSPSDSAGWCTCKACTALDETDPNGKLSITPRILKFYNDVAKLVAERFPDRIVCGYVYSSYLFPPKDRSLKLEPNLYLVWAVSFDYGFTLFRPELREQWDKALAGWTEMTDKFGYYDLCVNLSQEAGAPNPPGVKILQHIFPRLKQKRVKSLYLYGISAWGHAGLLNYTLAKLMWDADADVNALVDEFCDRAYGKGAAEMKQIYRMLDAAMEAHYIKDETARYTMTPTILKAVYAAHFAEMERLHQQALAKATDPKVKARLTMFGENLTVLCWTLGQHKLLPNAEQSAYYLSMPDFNAFMTARTGSLALREPRRRMKRRRLPKLEVTSAGKAPNAEPMTRYGLRGDMNIVVYAVNDGPIEITFTRLIRRGRFVRYVLSDAAGKTISAGVAGQGYKLAFDGVAGRYYLLQIQAGPGTFQIAGSAPCAIDAAASERGVHFQSGATPVYFVVPEGTERFHLILGSNAPG